MFFHGKGAGSLPSASAVLSDIVDIAMHRRAVPRTSQRCLTTRSSQFDSQRYLRFPVSQPSAIGTITEVFEKYGIRVTKAAATWAKRPGESHEVKLVTLSCAESALNKALQNIAQSGTLNGKWIALSIAA
jgi:homoserine dehydrogenase